MQGRLEVCFSGRWGTVSGGGWTQANAEVICNDLGYDFSGRINVGTSNFSPLAIIICVHDKLAVSW